MTSTGAERFRILIDVSASWRITGGNEAAAVRAEREIALRLLADASLPTLPIVFVADHIYALRAEEVTALLNTAPQRCGPEADPQQRQPMDPVAQSRSGREGWRAAFSRTGLRFARWAATAAYRLTPQRAQGELIEFFRQGKRVASTLLRPAGAVSSRSSPVNPARLASNPVVYPARGDLVWCAGASSGHVPLRRLAEERLRDGFAVATLCMSVDVSAAITLDLLDSADIIFCASDQVMADLRGIAASHGRRPPDLRHLAAGAKTRAEWGEAADRLRTDLLGLARSLDLA